MKHHIALYHLAAVILVGFSLITPSFAGAATILQGSGASFVAFEAEENVQLTPGTPTSFTITNDVTPSGSTALFASGANNTTFPTSFASYAIKFSAPGTYKVFFRWRANEDFTTDPNAANSFYAPTRFGASTSPVNPNPDYTASTVNNTRVKPESHTYHVDPENTSLLTVSQAQVDAGIPLIFTIGTREAGMMFDRFVLTTDSALSEAQFNATPNSDTDVFVQPSGANYVAFEAETPKGSLTPGTPTSFTITNDVTPSGSTALFASGANGTTFPSSFASYAIKFSTPGTYKFFFRWRANEDFTTDPNAANSFYAPTRFGASTNPINPNPDYTVSTVNNTRVKPESHTYHVDPENTSLLTVSQAQVDAGVPLIFTIGTREAGMMFDRFVLTTDSALSEAQFNALENTGAVVPPVITRVVGSGSLDYVKVSFSKALNQNVDPNSFAISGGVNVLSAVLDLNTLKDVILTTSPQTPGTLYTLVVNDVYDLNDAVIAPNTTTNFYAWALAPGFSKREIYFTIPGTDVNSLLNSLKFPNSPEQVDVVRGLASINLPRARDYGVRLTGFFTPAQTGVYDFFMYNNDEARLSVSTDATAANLQPILTSPSTATMEFTAGAMGALPDSLIAGQRYYIEVLLKQGNDYDAFVNVAARRQGDPTPISSLAPLSTEISTFVDPAAAILNIAVQPSSVTTASGHRARFEVRATSPNGPVFYQWQRNGINIPGATRAAYYTPILNTGNSGDQYRALIWGGGALGTSAVANVTVNAGAPPALQPFVGINFTGGGTDGPAGVLLSNDVAGVAPQANFNNLAGGTGTGVALLNADGTPSPVTATYNGTTWFTGTGESTAENVLFQGYLHNTNVGVTVTLNNVPPGNYNLIAYAVGFNFNAIYDQAMRLVGNTTYPVFHVRAEHGAQYNAAPSIFRRMSSTNAAARDQGNYVMFENVSPDGSGTLTLSVLNESPPENVGIGNNPALNGLQLVRVLPSTALTISRSGGTVTISWDASAAGFILESSSVLNPAVAWEHVQGTPTPITAAGSVSISPPLGAANFYRLRR